VCLCEGRGTVQAVREGIASTALGNVFSFTVIHAKETASNNLVVNDI